MAGSGIDKLRLPTKRFRPRAPTAIERAKKAKSEDAARARSLRRTAKQYPDHAYAFLELAERLDPEKSRRPTTCASKRYKRRKRVRIGGELHRLYVSRAGRGARTVTLISHYMIVTPEELLMLPAKAMCAHLRADLNRASQRLGVSLEGRWGFFGLDGEYDATTGLLNLHWHGLVSASMVPVIEELRNSPKYERHGSERPPVQIRDKPLVNVPKALTYLFKGTWFKRWRGVGTNGKRVAGPPSRIPDPAHSLWLLWMNRQRLQDMILLVGLRVVDGRLKPRNR